MRIGSLILAIVLAVGALSCAQSAEQNGSHPDREKLIGAWHMVSMEEQGAGGTLMHHTDRSGMLLYTTDGHFSVQVMYPEESAGDAYAKGGYEASFGSYDVDEHTHTVTHHVLASIVRSLIGKDLPRVMAFAPDGHLTLRSARPGEHWSVTWEHY